MNSYSVFDNLSFCSSINVGGIIKSLATRAETTVDEVQKNKGQIKSLILEIYANLRSADSEEEEEEEEEKEQAETEVASFVPKVVRNVVNKGTKRAADKVG